MTNAQITKAFLLDADTKTSNLIVTNIANHYGITNEDVFAEIYDDEAENLMDYVTGDIRPAVSLFFNKFKRSLKN